MAPGSRAKLSRAGAKYGETRCGGPREKETGSKEPGLDDPKSGLHGK